VESSSGSNKLELFPNPASNLVTIKFKNGKFLNGDICIKNVLGSIVISQKAINTVNSSIAISNLPNGVYFLTFTDEFKNVFQLKFVKT
jgi:hypothetical protein